MVNQAPQTVKATQVEPCTFVGYEKCPGGGSFKPKHMSVNTTLAEYLFGSCLPVVCILSASGRELWPLTCPQSAVRSRQSAVRYARLPSIRFILMGQAGHANSHYARRPTLRGQ